jgi:hypothetical protein
MQHSHVTLRDEAHPRCFLCGSTKDLSKDHIPPKGLFKPPLPDDLYTVMACSKCNSSYSLDEEYFRVCVATQGYWNDTGKWIWDQKVVGSSFRRSPRLRKAVAQKVLSLPVHTPSGIYCGEQGVILFDAGRVSRVVEKIAKGFFTIFRPNVDLRQVDFHVSMTRIDQELVMLLQQMKGESIGGRTFVFWRGFLQEEPRQSFWFFLFYEKTLFCVQTTPTKEDANPGTDPD